MAAVGVAIIAALLALHRALPYLSTHYLGGARGDTALYLWLTKEVPSALHANSWFTTRAFFPYNYSLAWSDNFILPSLLVQGLTKLGLSHILAWNALIITTLLVNGLASFNCARRLNLSLPASLLACGATISLLPILVNLGHPQLLFIFWFPLLVALATSHLESPRAVNGIFVALIVTGALLTTVYYAVFLGLIVIFLGLCFGTPTNFRRDVAALLVALPLVALATPIFLPYTEVRSALGPRDSSEAFYFAANLASFGATSPWSLWYGESAGLSHEEAFLFPGVLLLIVGLLATYLLLRSPRTKTGGLALLLLILALGLANYSELTYRLSASIVAWLALLFVGYRIRSVARASADRHLELIPVSVLFLGAILSLGPLGNHVVGETVLSPHGLLFQLVPGLDGIRAISRAGLIAVLMLPLITAAGLNRVRSIPAQWLCAGGLLIAIGTESQLKSLPLEPPTDPPPIIAKLKDLPDTSPFLVLPMALDAKNDGTISSWRSYAIYTADLMTWLADQPRPYVNGYSGIRSWVMTTYPRWLSSFPSDISLSAIARLVGVNTIVYLGSRDPRYDPEIFRETLLKLASRITVVAQHGDDYILRHDSWQPLDISHSARLIVGPKSRKLEFEIDAKSCLSEHQRDAITIAVINRGKAIDHISIPPGASTKHEQTVQPEYVEQGLIMLDFNSSSECTVRLRGVQS